MNSDASEGQKQHTSVPNEQQFVKSGHRWQCQNINTFLSYLLQDKLPKDGTKTQNPIQLQPQQINLKIRPSKSVVLYNDLIIMA